MGLGLIMVKESATIIHDLRREEMTIVLVVHCVPVALGAVDEVQIPRNSRIQLRREAA